MPAADEPARQVIYLQQAVEVLRDQAIERARSKLAPHDQSLPLAQLLQRADFLDYLRYQLATGIARILAENEPRVGEVYLYDPAGTQSADPAIHALVRVSAPSAALQAFISSLDRALLGSLRALPASNFAQRQFILDISLISDADVAQGRGYASMLSSLFAPPLKIWERDS